MSSECIFLFSLEQQGRQEDAEEFLSCLLNGLHDEMTSLIQSISEEENQPAGKIPTTIAPFP